MLWNSKSIFVLLGIWLPIVWFMPTFGRSDLQYFFGLDTRSAAASRMYRLGKRAPLSVKQVSDKILDSAGEIERAKSCYSHKISRITLGEPPAYAGHEVILHCPTGHRKYLGVYFDSSDQYLDTIAIRSP